MRMSTDQKIFLVFAAVFLGIFLLLFGCAFDRNARTVIDTGQEVEKTKIDHKRRVIEVQYK